MNRFPREKSPEITRRKFAVSTATLFAALNLPKAAFSQQSSINRKNIDDLTAQELKDYEDAVDQIKQRSVADPKDIRGYQHMADLHNVSRAHPDGSSGACEHGNEEFFPWHRAHLALFERLLQEINPTLSIPYWDWTKPPSGNRVPAAFERSGSSLFHSGRYPVGVPPVIWSAADVRSYVRERDWTLFAGEPKSTGGTYGNVEDEPHNALHPLIGPTMGDPGTAAEDPVYWSFHAYIDLIWARWQRLHPDAFECGGCTLWLEPASFTVVETARTEDFGYDYDYDFSIDTPVSPSAILVGSATNDVEIQSFSARSLNARPNPEWFEQQTQTFTEERRFLRLQGVQTFDDLTYQLNIYVHPDGLNLESLSREQRLQYLVRTKTIWRSHHGLNAENLANDGHEMHSRTSVLVDLSEQTEALEKDQWTISVIAESMPNVPAGTSNYDEQKAQEDLRLEDLDRLIDALQLEVR